ncbi:hypothetical protein [Allosphingosinicella sp.]|uniref:hypothetical protein n=1 Tax=Allosphingosinicella sp. TaxID=2823234 RepID=UPI003D719744
MEPRLLLAYGLMAALALCCLGTWLWVSREWRKERRGYRRSEVSRQRRRDERLRDERAA